MNIYLEALKRASANSSTRGHTKGAVQRFQQLRREVETGAEQRYLDKAIKKRKKRAPGFGKPKELKQAPTAILPPADVQRAIREGRKKGNSVISCMIKSVASCVMSPLALSKLYIYTWQLFSLASYVK